MIATVFTSPPEVNSVRAWSGGPSHYLQERRHVRLRMPALTHCARRGSRPSPTSVRECIMFKGKTALVTGSTSGIGLGVARAFAAQGANIVLNGFGDAAQIETIRAGIASEHGVTVRCDGADVTKPDTIETMMGN